MCVPPLQWLEYSTVSTATDAYSFGMIMYGLLTFKFPFESTTRPLVSARQWKAGYVLAAAANAGPA
jgi:serine/threonine protein kinase